MKKNVSSVLLSDKDVFDFLNEVKRYFSSKWIYLHFNVLKSIEICNCFVGYDFLKHLNTDGSLTELIKATFRVGEDELSLYLENCKIGREFLYYIIHSIKFKDEEIYTPSDPDDAIFFY